MNVSAYLRLLRPGLYPGFQSACQGVPALLCSFVFALTSPCLSICNGICPFYMHAQSSPPLPTKGHNTTYTTNGHIRVITVSPG